MTDNLPPIPEVSRRSALKLGGGGFFGLLSNWNGAPTPSPEGVLRRLRHTSPAIGKLFNTKSAKELAYKEILKAHYKSRRYAQKCDLDDLDIDIHVLKSVSPAMKLFMQRRRDEEHQNWTAALKKFFEVDDDDREYYY